MKKTNTETIKAIIATDEEIDRLKARRSEMVQNFIEESHPLKIDDVVVCTGYSYTGSKMSITYRGLVKVRLRPSGFAWTAKGLILKKDGTIGKEEGSWKQKVEVE